MNENMYIKPISYRKTKSGNWVVLAKDSELLVMDDIAIKCLVKGKKHINTYRDDLAKMLYENHFFTNLPDYNRRVTLEYNSLIYFIFRYVLFITGIISILVILVLSKYISFPNGNILIFSELSIWKSLIFMIIFSISTVFFHELMHIIYSRNWNSQHSGLRIYIKRSMAIISMTHIWTWSTKARIAAISAGIIFDLLILALISIFRLYADNSMLVLASAILWIRIIWQFRFHKNCDGKILAMMVIDNPMIDADANIKNTNKIKNNKTWILLKSIGYIIDIIIILVWIIPIVSNFINKWRL